MILQVLIYDEDNRMFRLIKSRILMSVYVCVRLIQGRIFPREVAPPPPGPFHSLCPENNSTPHTKLDNFKQDAFFFSTPKKEVYDKENKNTEIEKVF